MNTSTRAANQLFTFRIIAQRSRSRAVRADLGRSQIWAKPLGIIDTVRSVEIREFTSDDTEDAARLYLQSAEHHTELDPDFYRIPDPGAVVAHYEKLVERVKTGPLMCFVAESDETVVGLVEVRISDPPPLNSMLRPRRIASVDIVVDVDRRRQGIGKALMRRAETWARDQGATSLMLDMLRANEPAVAFYTALGYEDHGALLLKRHLGPE